MYVMSREAAVATNTASIAPTAHHLKGAVMRSANGTGRFGISGGLDGLDTWSPCVCQSLSLFHSGPVTPRLEDSELHGEQLGPLGAASVARRASACVPDEPGHKVAPPPAELVTKRDAETPRLRFG